MNVATFNQIKAVVGFNARFTQNVVGEDNLLAASAKTIADVEAKVVGGGAEATQGIVAAPKAEAAAPAVVAEGVAAEVNPPSSSPTSHPPALVLIPRASVPVSASVVPARNVSKRSEHERWRELEIFSPSLSFWRRIKLLTSFPV